MEDLGTPTSGSRPPPLTRAWWSSILPVPTPRVAGLLVVGAVTAALGPSAIGLWPLPLVAVLVLVDAALAPAPWRIEVVRELPATVALGDQGRLTWTIRNPTRRPVTVAVADEFAPSLGATERRWQTRVAAQGQARRPVVFFPARRGTFMPTTMTVRVTGPLGLATRQATRLLPQRLEIHPRFRSRHVAQLRVQRARLLHHGVRAVRGRGSSTEFEALREYVQGDEFRHVDWAATARAGVPIVRTHRAERNQTVLVLLDTGRVMAGLVDGVPRLDHGMDATLALATVATGVGDRIGMVAFGSVVRTSVPLRRDPGHPRRLSRAMHQLEPELAESGYHDAFRTVLARFRRRALLVLITELADEAVQESLLPALPLITREHAVVIGSVRDPAVDTLRDRESRSVVDAYQAAAATMVLDDRARAAARLGSAGALVLDEPPATFAGALADLYLDVKGRGRL